MHESCNREIRDPTTRKLVTCLDRLLSDVPLEMQLEFLHNMCVQFTLGTDSKGQYRARVYQNWRDPEDPGHVAKVTEWVSTGKSPKMALANAIADFLVSEGDDFHSFVNRGWNG